MIRIKNKRQINGIRKAGKMAADTLRYLEPIIKSGVSTNFINEEAENYIKKSGGIPACLGYNGFPKSICTSINEVVCHGVPSDKDILKHGDIINVDVTVIYDGYYGDTSRMFTIGDISEDAKNLIKITKECLDIGIDQVKPYNYFGNIGFYISQHAEKNGYSVVEIMGGHGIGLNFHEPPEIIHKAPLNSGEKMRNGMIFTIEPMISIGTADLVICENDGWTARTADGKLSAQMEHTVACIGNKYEILTL